MRRTLLLALGGLFAAGPAVAAPIGAPAECPRDLLFEGRIELLRAARIVAPGRVYFRDDGAGGPCEGPKCPGKAYVMNGDVVVSGRRRGPWVCVIYPNSRGGTEGWVRLDEIAPVAATAPGLDIWTGTWARGDHAELTVKRAGARLSVTGQALWFGSRPDNVNTGEIDAAGTPEGDTLRARDVAYPNDEGCHPSLRRLGPYLVVADDKSCGGLNVTFTGVYRR